MTAGTLLGAFAVAIFGIRLIGALAVSLARAAFHLLIGAVSALAVIAILALHSVAYIRGL